MKKIVLIFLLCVNSAFATTFDSNITNGCDENTLYVDDISGHGKLNAYFVPNSHTCASGYFLPANTDGCRACPNGYTCPSGTFSFNERQAQGINKNTYITTNTTNICSDNFLPYGHMHAVFVPNDPDVITVYFDNNGTIETTTCEADGELTLPTTPTRVGYVFTGWKVKNAQ